MESAKSAVKSAPTATPSIKKVAAGNERLTITWGKVSAASGYQLYMYNSTTKKYVKVATLSGNTKVTYTKTGLKGNTAYKFKVRTYRTAGGNTTNSAFSAVKAGKTNPQNCWG